MVMLYIKNSVLITCWSQLLVCISISKTLDSMHNCIWRINSLKEVYRLKTNQNPSHFLKCILYFHNFSYWYLCAYLFICLPIYLSTYLSFSLSVCLSVRSSICLSVYLSLSIYHLSVCMSSLSLSVCHLSICMYNLSYISVFNMYIMCT
jgi:hypothetical protein